ncbi:MAG: hypothetical protein PF518_13675 [Spirochaetaceae bacterium]|jgi:hypothetical protein|nr:hypothetical protein [Spirochaetaceae bacterium]
MDFEIISTMEGASYIKNETEKFLAIESGLKSKSFRGVDTSKLQSLPGLRIKNGEITNWKLKGVTEIDGKMVYYGPYLLGKTFAELEITPQILLELTRAFQLIKEKHFPVHEFSLSSVFRTDDGEILFFPPYLMDFLNTHRLKKNSFKMIFPWNNPKLSGVQGKSFTIAALAYRSLTGEKPFPGKDEEEIEKQISKCDFKSPLLQNPLLKEEIVSLIDESFHGNGNLEKWIAVLSNWISTGSQNETLTSDEKNRILENQNKVEKRRIQKNSLSRFFEKNRNKLIIGLIIIVILGAIIQAPLSKALQPPVTLGMSQKEVLKLYYSSFKTLDTETLEDTITRQAGKGDINEVSTIYVTSKVRTSYEGSSGMIDPEQWKLEGMNPVEPGVQIWGIAELKLQQINTDTFEATYEKWTPGTIENIEDNTPRMPDGYKVKDILHLSLIKDAWKIDEIKRTVNRF